MPEPPRSHIPKSPRKRRRRPTAFPATRMGVGASPNASSVGSPPTPLLPVTTYKYVLSDIKRIGIIVAPMIILIIILSFFL